VIVLSPLTVALPLAGAVAPVTVRLSPSMSESFARTATVAAVLPLAVTESLTAVGLSLTGVTVTATEPMSVWLPSLTVYENESAPL
jgi:hypothetical protein